MTDINWWTLAAGLIGALFGAGGAVCAQIVSARFTAKREDARLNLEQARYEKDAVNRARDLVFESKRVAFVQALKLADEMRQLLLDGITVGAGIDKMHSSLYPVEKGRWWVNWRESRAEVSLLDSLLRNDMEIVQTLLSDYNQDISQDGVFTALDRMKEIDAAIESMREAMQLSLGTEKA